jgi:tetratricopeptide (TPR) repeat protein
MKQYFVRRGLLTLAERATSEALAHPGARTRDAERSRALFALGQVHIATGHYAGARACLEESLAIGREIGSRQRIAAALVPLAGALTGLGDLPGARRCYDEAITLAREIGDKRELAAALNNRAQLHRAEGEPEAARQIYEQVLGLMREVDDPENIAIVLLNLAMIEVGRGAHDAARGFLSDALAIVAKTGSKPASQSVVEVGAGLAAQLEEWERAARLFGAAEAHAAQTGIQRDSGDEAFLAPLIAHARANSPPAQFAAAEAAGRLLSLGEALAEVRAWLRVSTR